MGRGGVYDKLDQKKQGSGGERKKISRCHFGKKYEMATRKRENVKEKGRKRKEKERKRKKRGKKMRKGEVKG